MDFTAILAHRQKHAKPVKSVPAEKSKFKERIKRGTQKYEVHEHIKPYVLYSSLVDHANPKSQEQWYVFGKTIQAVMIKIGCWEYEYSLKCLYTNKLMRVIKRKANNAEESFYTETDGIELQFRTIDQENYKKLHAQGKI